MKHLQVFGHCYNLSDLFLFLPEVAEESAGRATAVETAAEGSGSKVRADPVLKVAGMTEVALSWAAVIVVGLAAAVVKVPAAEEAELDRKVVESIQAATETLAGLEKDPVTEGDPGTGGRKAVLTVTVESGNMEVGPEGDHGGPEVARKRAHSGHGGAQGIAGNKGAESLEQWRAVGGMETAGGLHEMKGLVVHSSHLGSDHNYLGHAVHSSSKENTIRTKYSN